MDSNYFILLIYLRTLLYFHLNQFALLTKASLVPIIPTLLLSSNSADPFPSIIMTKVVILFPQVQTALMRSIRGGGRWGGTYHFPFSLRGAKEGQAGGPKASSKHSGSGKSKKGGEEGGRKTSEGSNRRLGRKRARNLGHKQLEEGRSPRPATHSPHISAGGRQCAGGPHCSPGRLEGQLEATQWGMPSAKDR